MWPGRDERERIKIVADWIELMRGDQDKADLG